MAVITRGGRADRKETFVKAMAAAFAASPPPASPKLADDARQQALR